MLLRIDEITIVNTDEIAAITLVGDAVLITMIGGHIRSNLKVCVDPAWNILCKFTDAESDKYAATLPKHPKSIIEKFATKEK